MKLDHIAILTGNIEILKDYYVKYFNGIPGEKYTNPRTLFQSYFITFDSGARLEVMTIPVVPTGQEGMVTNRQKGIVHLAFGVETGREVEEKAKQLEADGFKIVRGPRTTGDGYFEFETLDPDGNLLEVTSKTLTNP